MVDCRHIPFLCWHLLTYRDEPRIYACRMGRVCQKQGQYLFILGDDATSHCDMRVLFLVNRKQHRVLVDPQKIGVEIFQGALPRPGAFMFFDDPIISAGEQAL